MSGSEHLNGMTEEEAAKTVEDMAAMTEEQRQAYFSIFDPDAMGFDGEEGV